MCVGDFEMFDVQPQAYVNAEAQVLLPEARETTTFGGWEPLSQVPEEFWLHLKARNTSTGLAWAKSRLSFLDT